MPLVKYLMIVSCPKWSLNLELRLTGDLPFFLGYFAVYPP
jgi:hypothetical protein